MTTLELKCLGGLAITQDGVSIPGLKSSKGQALLCYLALSGKRVTRSTLAGMFWMDMPEIQARMNLRKALNRLKPLRTHLLIDRTTLAFNYSTPHWLDVKEFETAAADLADSQRLQYAESLYQGDFLIGAENDAMPVFSDWVLNQRTQLHESAVNCLRTLIRHFTDLRNYPAAIHYARRLLSIENWNEEVHCELMSLLYRSGQRSAAIKQFDLCRSILLDELGVEPSPATIDLYHHILEDGLSGKEPSIPGAVSFQSPMPVHNLPSLSTPLIGRMHERTKLKNYLSDPNIRMVSVVGAGGMGKTHLTLFVAHELASGPPLFEGIFFVALGAVSTRQHMLIAMANSLDLNLSGARDPEKLLLNHLQDKNYLIVLDNFEQLLTEEDILHQMIETAPRIKLLITTRQRTKLLQEWVFDLYGLSFPEKPEDIQETDAVRLFEQRARQRFSEFSLEQNYRAVVHICQLVQGMPLALELAASWIRVMTAAEIADQIVQSYHSLTTELNNLPERHRTMQAVFDSSWKWLSADEQSVLRKLSVFRAGFSLDAGQRVAGASLPILSSLMDKSFLTLDTRSRKITRYEMHELVRQYAEDQLLISSGMELTHQHHLMYFLTLTEQAEQFWDTTQEAEWLQNLETERNNLHAGLRWALNQENTQVLLRLNAALFTFWIYKSPISEAKEWLDASLALPWDKTQTAILRTRGKVLNVAGYSDIQNANYDLAFKRFEEGLELYSLLDQQKEAAWSLRGCGFVAMIQGDYAKAQPYVTRSLAICQEIQDEWGTAWSIYDLGYLALARNRFAKARTLLESAHQQFHKLGILFGEYRSLIALGDVLRGLKHWDHAFSLYQEALIFQREYQYSQFVADIFEGLAQLALVSGDFWRAARLFGAAQKRRDTIEMARWARNEAEFQHGLALLRAQLSEEDFTGAWMEGYTMTTAEIIDYSQKEALLPVSF